QPCGTQWLEHLSREPSQHYDPPIPGPSPSSKPPEVAQTQSTEDPFACPATPRSIIIIDGMPVGSSSVPPRTPVPSSPHSYDDACQEFTNLRPTLMIPRAIVHKAINQILLENGCLLHMIPFVDASH
ncbi:hypothetical protein O181_079303, partial [Austropuccinia psidii MF-1]|nr:hypothetical protein [Austropuccinia psidii MF-1]